MQDLSPTTSTCKFWAQDKQNVETKKPQSTKHNPFW